MHLSQTIVLCALIQMIYLFSERLEHRLTSKRMCPKKEGALASNEFISKLKTRGGPICQIPEDVESLEEQMEAANLSDSSEKSQEKPNGQM